MSQVASLPHLFFSKTRKGKVRRIVKERYLRSDIGLGVTQVGGGLDTTTIENAPGLNFCILELINQRCNNQPTHSRLNTQKIHF